MKGIQCICQFPCAQYDHSFLLFPLLHVFNHSQSKSVFHKLWSLLYNSLRLQISHLPFSQRFLHFPFLSTFRFGPYSLLGFPFPFLYWLLWSLYTCLSLFLTGKEQDLGTALVQHRKVNTHPSKAKFPLRFQCLQSLFSTAGAAGNWNERDHIQQTSLAKIDF